MLKKFTIIFLGILFMGASCIKKQADPLPQNPPAAQQISHMNIISLAEEYLNTKLQKPAANKKVFSSFISYGEEVKNDQLYYYMWALREEYEKKGAKLVEGTKYSSPVLLVFGHNEKEYNKVLRHELPENGQNYTKSFQKIFPENIRTKMALNATDNKKRNDLLHKEVMQKAAQYFNFKVPDSLDDIQKEKCTNYSFERYKMGDNELKTDTIADWDQKFNSSTVPVYEKRAKIAIGYFAGEVNFAGHFMVVSTDCGSKCQEHAVIDALTGRILKSGIISQYGVEYKLNSRVFVVNPYRAILEPEPNNIATQYYVLEEKNNNSNLKLVCNYNDKKDLVPEAPVTPAVNTSSTVSTSTIKDYVNQNPQKRYVSTDREECTTMLFRCKDNEKPFFDDTGCGCVFVLQGE